MTSNMAFNVDKAALVAMNGQKWGVRRKHQRVALLVSNQQDNPHRDRLSASSSVRPTSTHGEKPTIPLPVSIGSDDEQARLFSIPAHRTEAQYEHDRDSLLVPLAIPTTTTPSASSLRAESRAADWLLQAHVY